MNFEKCIQLYHQNHDTDYFCHIKIFLMAFLNQSSLLTHFLIITGPPSVSILSPFLKLDTNGIPLYVLFMAWLLSLGIIVLRLMDLYSFY